MKKEYHLIVYYLSFFVILIGFVQLIPLVVLPFYPDEIIYAPHFIVPGVLSILGGLVVRSCYKNFKIMQLPSFYDSILVVITWISAIVISAVPWMLTGHYNFTQAVFEMTSGYSTTGLSVVDVTHCPHIFLFFRTVTLFVGGVGLVLVVTSVLSDRLGLNLYHAEGHSDRLLPNLAKSAQLILSIYSFYIVAGTIAYVIAGMDWFAAINHSVACLSTGGFSVHPQSIYGYHSAVIEIITIVLMILGNTNFLVHYFLIKRRFKTVLHHCEIRFMIIALLIVVPLMAIILVSNCYEHSFLESLRISVFQLVSALSTTGFQSVETMKELPNGFLSILILAMVIGGGIESTAGGIKQYRFVLSIKSLAHYIRQSMSNTHVIRTNYIQRAGKKIELSDGEVKNTSFFIIIYLIFFFIGSWIFTCFGYNLQDAMFEFSSSLSTVGLSVGIVGYSAHPIILWTSTIGMFIGRLEIIIVFHVIIRVLYDIKKKELT